MAANCLQCDGWATKTFVTHKARFVMHCPQVIHNGALILAHLSAPGAVGHPIEEHSMSGSYMLIKPITLGDSDGDTALKNFRPFSRVFRE